MRYHSPLIVISRRNFGIGRRSRVVRQCSKSFITKKLQPPKSPLTAVASLPFLGFFYNGAKLSQSFFQTEFRAHQNPPLRETDIAIPEAARFNQKQTVPPFFSPSDQSPMDSHLKLTCGFFMLLPAVVLAD